MKAPPLSSGAIGAILLVADVVGLIGAFNVVHKYSITTWLGIGGGAFFALAGAVILTLYVMECYRVDDAESVYSVPMQAGFGVVVSGIVVAGVLYITETWDKTPLVFRGVLPGSLVLFAAWAVTTRIVIARWVWSAAADTRWLVIGEGAPLAQLSNGGRGQLPIGKYSVITSDPEYSQSAIERNLVIGSYGDFNAVKERQWNGVIVAAANGLPDRMVSDLMEMRLKGTRIYDLADFYERYLLKVPILHLEDRWFALAHGFDLLHHNVQMKIKRITDVILAVALLVVSLPIQIVITLAIFLDRQRENGGPILYKQVRTGVDGREFHLYKFRTMVQDAERAGVRWADPDDPRVTRIGRILRRSRLDELPQLWNVLKGEMSFIGPRPERPEFNHMLKASIPYYNVRHFVKPGITGWAQVMYPYGSSIEDAIEKLQYDIYYIKNYSLALDVAIILKTLRVVLRRRGR